MSRKAGERAVDGKEIKAQVDARGVRGGKSPSRPKKGKKMKNREADD